MWYVRATTKYSLLASLCLLTFSDGISLASPVETAGEVVSVSGLVFVRPDSKENQKAPKPAKPGDSVRPGDVINTSSNGAIKILLKDKSVIDLGASTMFKVNAFNKQGGADRQVDLQIGYGTVRAAVTQKLKGKGAFKLRTPSATMGVRGTIAFGEVKAGDNLGSSRGAPGNTTFLITQGQGVVTSNGGAARSPEIVLNPGDQTVSSGNGAPPARQTLTGEQFTARQNEVNNVARGADNAFALATNFDRAMQQRQEQQAATHSNNGQSDEEHGNGKDKEKDKDKDKDKDQDSAAGGEGSSSGDGSGTAQSSGESSETAAAEGESGSRDIASTDGGSGDSSTTVSDTTSQPPTMMDSIAADIGDIAPPPPAISISNVGIAGAPSPETILADQTSTSATPAATTGRLQVNVRWK
jgi:hypothetical protein